MAVNPGCCREQRTIRRGTDRTGWISASLFAILMIAVVTVAGTQTTYKGTVNNLSREWIFFVPDNLPASPPLVFFLQGCCSDYSTWPSQTGYNTLADTAKTIVCYPAAINEGVGKGTFFENISAK
jgi:poly(3-hydroxybutyrate) depolymerase